MNDFCFSTGLGILIGLFIHMMVELNDLSEEINKVSKTVECIKSTNLTKELC